MKVREADYTKLYQAYELVANARQIKMDPTASKNILMLAAQLHREHYEDNYGKT